MTVQSRFSLLAATRQIGWGGVGKLRLILEKLPGAGVTIYGDERTVTATRQFLGSEQKFDANPPSKFDVALVINDPTMANNISNLNVPVVYVDSMPYLRETDAEIPKSEGVAHYCAQKYPLELHPPPSFLLQKCPDITWIDPIVPRPRSRRGGRGIVINLGGLYSYNLTGLSAELVADAVDAYLNLVLFPLVEFLLRSDRTISAICGAINADSCMRLRAIVPDGVAVGPQLPSAFERTLADADLLITAPGSTTMLQAMSIGLPTLLLPPQNRSQPLNARIFSKPGADVMNWPNSVLDAAEMQRLSSKGVVALNSYFYRSMIDAAASRNVSDEVSTIIRNAVLNAREEGVLKPGLPALGGAGADQVSRLIEQVALWQQ